MLTTVPFSGFYESLHDSEIDWTMEQMFTDDSGDQIYPGLDELLWRDCDFRKVHLAYAQDYVEQFAREFNLKTLEWESMVSPREYNFTTDSLFAEISTEEFLDLLDTVDNDAFHALAKQNFTSRDGFMSWYSPDIGTWGPPELWDHNQVGTLLAAHAGPDFDHYAEHSLMEDARGNGDIDNWVCAATPSIDRLYKVYNYLEARALR